MEQLTCISCKKKVTNQEGVAQFKCPQCNKETIVRCKHCREIASKFTCPSCKFVGPN